VLATDHFCAALTTVCELVLPLIDPLHHDTAMRDFASLTADAILKLGGLYVLLRLMDTGAYLLNDIHRPHHGLSQRNRPAPGPVGHLQALSKSYYDNAKTGQLMSRITTDLNDVTEFAQPLPAEFFIAALNWLGVFAILCTMNVGLTLIIFIALPLMLLALGFFNKNMRKAFKSARYSAGELNAQWRTASWASAWLRPRQRGTGKEQVETGNRRF
jgi:ATP-binding cassette subfamily B protein